MWRGDLLADDREAQTHLFYDQYWAREPQGYGGESWYTHSTNKASAPIGMWAAPAAGNICFCSLAKHQHHRRRLPGWHAGHD
jgi:hypothetical protein